MLILSTIVFVFALWCTMFLVLDIIDTIMKAVHIEFSKEMTVLIVATPLLWGLLYYLSH